MPKVNIPNKWSLAQFTGLPAFKNTQDGKTEESMFTEAVY